MLTGVGHSNRPRDSCSRCRLQQPPLTATAAATGFILRRHLFTPLLPRLPRLRSSVSTPCPEPAGSRGGGAAAALPQQILLSFLPFDPGGSVQLQSGYSKVRRPHSRPGRGLALRREAPPPKAGKPATPLLHGRSLGRGEGRPDSLEAFAGRVNPPTPLHPYSYPSPHQVLFIRNNRAAIFESGKFT